MQDLTKITKETTIIKSMSVSRSRPKRKLPDLRLAHIDWLLQQLQNVCKMYNLACEKHPFMQHWVHLLNTTPDNRRAVFTALSHPIATFSLLTGANSSCTIHVPERGDFVRDVTKRPLIKPDFLVASENQLSCSKAGACRLRTSQKTPYSGREDAERCTKMRHAQFHNRITLKPRNLCTLVPGKWLDSAVMDAWWYGLHKNFRQADKLYIISAEKDPDLDMLRYTDGCYDYILQVLYYRDHWTCMFINHRCKEIFYFNSQLSRKTASEQLQPYKDKFPDYAVEIAEVPQQQDRFSCGVFVCWFGYCLLNCPELIYSLQATHSDEMRQAILEQLLVWYVL